MSLHICSPTGYRWRSIIHCSTCGCRRLMLVEHYVWYPTDVTCLTCGDRWSPSEGGRHPRPFQRGWRAESVRRAKAVPYTTKTEARAALANEVATYDVSDVVEASG